MSKYGSARELMEAMERGEIPRRHLGKKTIEVVRQELFSLQNRYKPQTMTDKEIDEWNAEVANTLGESKNFTAAEWEQMMGQVNRMLEPNA